MGVSTDAILVYGVPLTEGALSDYREEGEESTHPLARMLYGGDPVDGVVLVEHCSDECPEHILAIEGTETTAYRGYPKDIPSDALAVGEGWAEEIASFVQKYGLAEAVEGEPRWLLCSYWG